MCNELGTDRLTSWTADQSLRTANSAESLEPESDFEKCDFVEQRSVNIKLTRALRQRPRMKHYDLLSVAIGEKQEA
jgi:hypothetical protein